METVLCSVASSLLVVQMIEGFPATIDALIKGRVGNTRVLDAGIAAGIIGDSDGWGELQRTQPPLVVVANAPRAPSRRAIRIGPIGTRFGMRSFFGTFSSTTSAAAVSAPAAPAPASRLLSHHRLPTPSLPRSLHHVLPPCSISASSEFPPARPFRASNPGRASHRSVRSTSSTAADSMASYAASAERKPFAVLFVCLGNICRSPAAEGVFWNLVNQKGLDAHFKIDSAGTIGYHEGNPADARMRAASKRRGIEITSISRPIRPFDFRDFDLILAMDLQNKADILAAYERWRVKEQLPENAYNKVKLMCSYCKQHNETEVPDPYYGGPQGFEKVLDLLEDACSSLLDCILAENSHISNS